MSWLQSLISPQQYNPLMWFTINMGFIARIITAAYSLNTDPSSKILDSRRSHAAFWASMTVTYLGDFLKDLARQSGNPTAVSLITGAQVLSSAWQTYHVAKGAWKGLSLCWQNRCYVEEVRPIPIALLHSVTAYNVLSDFQELVASLL